MPDIDFSELFNMGKETSTVPSSTKNDEGEKPQDNNDSKNKSYYGEAFNKAYGIEKEE